MEDTSFVTESKFRRLHPGVEIAWSDRPLDTCFSVLGFDRKKDEVLAEGVGKTQREALYDLSSSLLRLAVREKAADQDWEDCNTGNRVPLQGHHRVKRSKAGPHTKANLSATSRRTHEFQHERKKHG